MPDYWFASRRHYFVKNHGRAYAALALLARLAGGAIHTLRRKLSGKPSQDPAFFMRDLARFGFGLSRAEDVHKPTTPVPEDRL